MNSGADLLDVFYRAIEIELNRIADSTDMKDALMTVHRVIMITLSSHIKKMIEEGVSEEDIDLNISAVREALAMLEEYDIELFCTMPGGDA